jgi:DNA modification methylase
VFWKVIDAIGWKIHEQLVWVKDSMVLGHSDYHLKHESILYGWTPGDGRPGRGNHEGSHWYGDNSQVSVFEIPRPKRSEEHPTMKPVELVEAQLQNSTRPGDLVYEPFSGSGTTLIACERLGRKCRAVEISPAYVAVAIQRWADMGVGEPELVRDA